MTTYLTLETKPGIHIEVTEAVAAERYPDLPVVSQRCDQCTPNACTGACEEPSDGGRATRRTKKRSAAGPEPAAESDGNDPAEGGN